MIKDAIISEDGKYRYQLSRKWDKVKPMILFIMLNPSTADAEKDDPTIRRCMGFAKSWGYGGIFVGNLFSYRATEPGELLNVNDPYGHGNLSFIMEMAGFSDKVICAWGNEKTIKKVEVGKLIIKKIFKLLKEKGLYYLELTKGGTPKHPLYLRGNLEPKRFLI